MTSMIVQTAIVLSCFAAAFALSKLVDRLSRRVMSQLFRGLFTFAVGFVLLEVVAASLVMIECRLSSCDL